MVLVIYLALCTIMTLLGRNIDNIFVATMLCNLEIVTTHQTHDVQTTLCIGCILFKSGYDV